MTKWQQDSSVELGVKTAGVCWVTAFQDFQERLALTICQVKEPKSPSQETVLSFYLSPLPCYMRLLEGGEQGA